MNIRIKRIKRVFIFMCEHTNMRGLFASRRSEHGFTGLTAVVY